MGKTNAVSNQETESPSAKLSESSQAAETTETGAAREQEISSARPATKSAAATVTPWKLSDHPMLVFGAAVIGLAAYGQLTSSPTSNRADETLNAAADEMLVNDPAASEPNYEPLELGATLDWSADSAPDEVVRQAGPFVIKITKQTSDDLVAPLVSVSANGQEVVLKGESTSPSFTHKISLFTNRNGATPVVMLQSFSGGAHCCNNVQLADFSNDKLAKINLGSWDGDSVDLPSDIDHDGQADFIMRDDRFLYAFSSYASSFAPPQILNVVNGQAVDVSSKNSFRSLFSEILPEAETRCVSGDSADTRNGACPAYIAAAARAGSLDESWNKMLQAYDATSDWSLPTGCQTRWAKDCPDGQEITFKSYPESLLYFLKANNYIAKSWLPPELRSKPEMEEDDIPFTIDENATDSRQ